VEHRFTGPPCTLRVEEHKLLDSETLELANSVESILEAEPAPRGDIKAELMESVVELATGPWQNATEASDQFADPWSHARNLPPSAAWRVPLLGRTRLAL
jgi:glutamate---cysteine ligase / carboxylate-amine ligase